MIFLYYTYHLANYVAEEGPGAYRVIYVARKKSSYVGVLQHTPGGGFKLCEAITEASCSRSTKRSVVRNLWERATKKKGKGKSDVGAACPLPSKKPTEKTPTAKKPKTKTPKKKTKSKTKGGKL